MASVRVSYLSVMAGGSTCRTYHHHHHHSHHPCMVAIITVLVLILSTTPSCLLLVNNETISTMSTIFATKIESIIKHDSGANIRTNLTNTTTTLPRKYNFIPSSNTSSSSNSSKVMIEQVANASNSLKYSVIQNVSVANDTSAYSNSSNVNTSINVNIICSNKENSCTNSTTTTSTTSTGDHHQHHNHHHHSVTDKSDPKPAHLHCEYDTVRLYTFTSVVQSSVKKRAHTKATVAIRCLHQITWGENEQQDRLNGQKYLAYISSFHPDVKSADKRVNFQNSLERSKRSIYQYLEHLWSDFKNMLPFEEEEESSPHDEFDQNLLQTMESELRGKCHSILFWEEFQMMPLMAIEDKCSHCTTTLNNNNLLSKFSLPFWFVQLEDGSIPQIRFTKQETQVDVKNFKKFIVSLLVTQLNNTFNWSPIESTVLGKHRSHYKLVNQHNNSEQSPPSQPPPHQSPWLQHNELSQYYSAKTTNISNVSNIIKLEKHIDSQDLEQINNNKQQTDELLEGKDHFPLNITFYQQQELDIQSGKILTTNGQIKSSFGPIQFNQYSYTINEFWLEQSNLTVNSKVNDVLIEFQERYTESQEETLVAQPMSEENLLQVKYFNWLYKLRNDLGPSEHRYYTGLFEQATSKVDSQGYDNLLSLVALEQKLNHSAHQHYSVIGDLRRIGTIRNIQLVCGPNLTKLESNKCVAFLNLLLRSSSKTAQHLLLYSLQNQNDLPTSKALLATRLLVHTYRPSRWLVENLAHETHHQASNRPMETVLLQTLVLLAQQEQLVKLKELLSAHLVKRITGACSESVSAESELYAVDLIEMIGNLNNYTALQSVQALACWWQNTELVQIATIHAYRRSINRSQIQNLLGQLFLSANSCQIKQEIVQLLIDQVDLYFWQQTPDKKWPQYGFNALDDILAQELSYTSTNCVHHLIIEYFKRKVNSRAHKYVAELEASQNYNASSFDFCINERHNLKCDYVQTLGSELASVEMKKSIAISMQSAWIEPKVAAAAAAAASSMTSQAASSSNGSSSSTTQPTTRHFPATIYSRHSMSALLFRYKLTVAHLSVLQTMLTQEQVHIRVQLETYQGTSIPLAKLVLDKKQLVPSAISVKIAQFKLTVPVKVVHAEQRLQADNELLVQLHAFFEVSLETKSESLVSELVVKIRLENNAELTNAGLTLQRSLLLQTHFEYKSKQPTEITKLSVEQTKNLSVVNFDNNKPDNNAPILFGSESFISEIELSHHASKFEPQCNTWIEQSPPQQLNHWNSSLKQSNLFSLPLQYSSPPSASSFTKLLPNYLNVKTIPTPTPTTTTQGL